MVSNKTKIVIEKMISYALDSREFSETISYDEFLLDRKLVGFTVFALLQLGELVAKLDDDFYVRHPNIPWSQIKGLRNRIVHHYEGVNLRTVWDIIQDDIPELICNLTAICESLS